MTSTALVGPLPRVTFRGGPDREPVFDVRALEDYYASRPYVVYSPPRNTCDPRYAACTDHHVACDCREAEWAEERQEHLYARREAQQAVDEILAGHPTRVIGGPSCECTGCRLVRAMHLYPTEGMRIANGVSS